MSNPFEDALAFLSANTGDFLALGLWRFALLALFYALLAASLFVAALNLADELERRRGSALFTDPRSVSPGRPRALYAGRKASFEAEAWRNSTHWPRAGIATSDIPLGAPPRPRSASTHLARRALCRPCRSFRPSARAPRASSLRRTTSRP